MNECDTAITAAAISKRSRRWNIGDKERKMNKHYKFIASYKKEEEEQEQKKLSHKWHIAKRSASVELKLER